METHFPKTLGWIWRFKVDEGIYIGAKNIALDELSGKFDVSVKNGKVWFSIKDGIAAIRAYHSARAASKELYYGQFQGCYLERRCLYVL